MFGRLIEGEHLRLALKPREMLGSSRTAGIIACDSA